MSPVAIDALKEALVAAFWYRGDVRRFLATAVDDQALLAGIDWEGNYKWTSVHEFVDRLAQNQGRYQDQLIRLMVDVGHMEEFPRLARADDRELRTREATAAVKRLRAQTKPYEEQLIQQERDRERIRAAQASVETNRAFAARLAKLDGHFRELHSMDNPQQRGTALESFLRELFKLFDLDPRAAFRITGEQIDGSFVLDNVNYLLESKWEKAAVERSALDAFEAKIKAKIENTLGLFVAIEGFQKNAIDKHSDKGAVMILADGGDLLAVTEGRIDLVEMLRRKYRHAAETGNIFLSAWEILG